MPLSVYRPAYSATPPKGSGFTNLQTYLQANRDNRLGQAVGGGIQKEAQGVQSQLGAAQSAFQQQAQQNRIGTAQDVQARQEALSKIAPPTTTTAPPVGSGPNVNPGAGPTAPETNQQPINAGGNTLQSPTITQGSPQTSGYENISGLTSNIQNILNSFGHKSINPLTMAATGQSAAEMQAWNERPWQTYGLGSDVEQLSKIIQSQPLPGPEVAPVEAPTEELPTLTPDQIAQFQKLAGGQYTGPTDIANIQDIQSRAQQTAQMGKDISTEAGRLGLVQRYAANPLQKYGIGQAQLDQLLLGTTSPALTQARQAVSGLGTDVSKAQQAAQATAADYAAKAKAFGEETGKQLTAAQQAAEQKGQGEFTAAQFAEQKRAQATNDIASLLQGGTLSEIRDPVTGDVIRPASTTPLNREEATRQAVQLATEQGLMSQSDLQKLQEIALVNPIMGLTTSNIPLNSANVQDILGTPVYNPYWAGTGGARPYYAPGTAQSIHDLLASNIRNQAAINLNSPEQAMSEATRQRLNLASQLAGTTAAGTALPTVTPYTRGVGGFDINKILSQYAPNIQSTQWLTPEAKQYLAPAFTTPTAPTTAQQLAGQASVQDILSSIPPDQLAKLNDPNTTPQEKQAIMVRASTAKLSTPGTQAASQYFSGMAGLFCYAEGTKIKMEDQSWKPVEQIQVGDKCFLGGEVLSKGEAKVDVLCDYKDEIVSGDHAVFEDGKFIRVKDSKLATHYKNTMGIKVYPIYNKNHLLVTESHIGSDEAEVDDSDKFNVKERLNQLNKNKNLLALLNVYNQKFIKQEVK